MRKKEKATPCFCYRTQRAFSLIESVIAIGIMGFIGLVVLSAIDTNSRSSGILDERVSAASVATACIEQIRYTDYASSYTGILNNIILPSHYNVEIIVLCSNDGENFVACTGSQTLQKITILVLHDEKPVLSTCTFKNDFEVQPEE